AGFHVCSVTCAAPLTTRDRAGQAPRSTAVTGCVPQDLNIQHRPSHAKRYGLSESGVSPLPMLTLDADHSVGADRPGLGGFSSRWRTRPCDIRHRLSSRFAVSRRFLARSRHLPMATFDVLAKGRREKTKRTRGYAGRLSYRWM